MVWKTRFVERIHDISENFTYDSLHRLRWVNRTRTGVSGSEQFETRYNAIGNITFKTGVGDYSYTGAQPHAVTQAGSSSYTYDARGNQLTRPGLELIHTAQNKLRELKDSGTGEVIASYLYDADATRVVHEDQEGTKVYVGGLYEKNSTASGKIEHKWSVQAPQGTAVEIRKTVENAMVTEEEFYPILDRLGSPVVITNASGEVVQESVFDAWGKVEIEGAESERPKMNLGYTGHKAEDVHGIIDMGGRQYDPVLARFLQPDVVVPSPHNMQSFNRYSYVMNNPFRYVDPSGYTEVGETEEAMDSPSWLERAGALIDTLKKKCSEKLDQLESFVEEKLNGLQDRAEAANKRRYGGDGLEEWQDDLTRDGRRRVNKRSAADVRKLAENGALELGMAVLPPARAKKGGKLLEELFEHGSDVTKRADDFFEGTVYTTKVKRQMAQGDLHSFPESVKAFQDAGTVSKLKGGDGIVRDKLEIPGVYRGRIGKFEFIKEPDGTINHRLFKADRE